MSITFDPAKKDSTFADGRLDVAEATIVSSVARSTVVTSSCARRFFKPADSNREFYPSFSELRLLRTLELLGFVREFASFLGA